MTLTALGRSSGDASAGRPPAVEASGLVKTYDEVEAVRGIDLAVRAGELFGFLGPNGAGKSSTMRMIGAVSPVTDGTQGQPGQALVVEDLHGGTDDVLAADRHA